MKTYVFSIWRSFNGTITKQIKTIRAQSFQLALNLITSDMKGNYLKIACIGMGDVPSTPLNALKFSELTV